MQLIHASPTSADALTTPFGTLMLPLSAVHLASSTLDAAGSAALPLSIPASPVLVGKRVWFQSVSIGAADIALSSPSLIVVAP